MFFFATRQTKTGCWQLVWHSSSAQRYYGAAAARRRPAAAGALVGDALIRPNAQHTITDDDDRPAGAPSRRSRSSGAQALFALFAHRRRERLGPARRSNGLDDRHHWCTAHSTRCARAPWQQGGRQARAGIDFQNESFSWHERPADMPLLTTAADLHAHAKTYRRSSLAGMDDDHCRQYRQTDYHLEAIFFTTTTIQERRKTIHMYIPCAPCNRTSIGAASMEDNAQDGAGHIKNTIGRPFSSLAARFCAEM